MFTSVAMWQRRWIGMAVAWAVAILGVAGVVYMRDRYEASARIFVDTETVLKPLMTGIAFQPDVDQQVKMLARTLISRPNIERLLQSPKIHLQWNTDREREKIIDRLMAEIKMAPSGNTNLFAITYRDINPQRAERIVEDLVGQFVVSGVGGKQRDSEQARKFLDTQISAYEVKLTEAENRLKDFKIRNFGLTGTSNQDYFARMSSLSDDVGRLRVELRAAEQGRDALRRELAAEDPSMPFDPAAPLTMGAAPSELDTRIDAQRRQLDDLMRRYTDAHPDVVSVKRTLAQLEAQRRAESEARRKERGASNRAPAPTSPVFQRIRVALAEAEAKAASLRGQLAEQQSQLEQIRSKAGKMPQMEAELAQLNRDYDIVRKNYEQLVSRRESASLGEKIDQTTKAAEFRLVEPPRVAPQPVKPSRLMVALLAFIAAVALGLGAAFGLTQLVPTVQDSKMLRALSGRPVLGSVSLVIGPDEAGDSARDRKLFFGMSALLVILNIGWIIVVSRQWLP
ncbi:MAG: chain length-determining protein [Burkholderiales bacterium]|nr:chain length-determining protein [Burkholderiales bacterium]